MKQIWLVIWLLVLPGWNDGPLKRAEQAFAAGSYRESIDAYVQAIHDYPLRSREIRYNIAQCYERMDSLEQAMEYYHQSVNTRKSDLASQASNQIGILLLRQDKPQQALAAWKQALKYDPDNETARYNYELLLKRILPDPEDPTASQRPDAPDDDRGEGDRDDPVASDAVREERRAKIAQWLQQFRQPPLRNDAARPASADTLSIGQAREILDVMRDDETKFLQQLRKTAQNPNRPKERPDW